MSAGELEQRGPHLSGSGRRTAEIAGLLRKYSFGFALILTVVLLGINIVQTPDFGWSNQLANFAPLALAAMASTPSIISGGGGFDLSISPLMILTSAVFVVYLVPHGLGGAAAVPIMLGIGAAIGVLNGLLVVLLRVQPVVVTLSMYFILIGVNLKIVPAPESISSSWVLKLAGNVGPIPGALFTIGTPLLIWVAIGCIAYRRILYAVGSNDAAAYSAGCNVALTRVVAYGLGGLFAGIGGLAVVAIGSSASATLSSTYTLVAIAAVAMGGTSLWGGRGGLLGSLLGAASLYLMGNTLVLLQINPSWLQVLYGVMLIVAVIFVSLLTWKEDSE